MRLGIVMMGSGAHAAANLGVMKELARRGAEPFAVCGMQWGAWPAALFAAGLDTQGMEKALHQAAGMGRRMITPSWYERWMREMPACACLNHLLAAQTGQRILSLCPRAALFPGRLARNGQRVVFSTRAFMQESGVMLSMQATTGFAARAAMALPPMLRPVQFMGSPVLGETDAAFACRQLLRLGAHRVLVVAPCPSARRDMDAMDLMGMSLCWAEEQPLSAQIGVLRVVMPDTAGAMDFEQMPACCAAGEFAARRELDAIFDQLGMAFCRVLPFRRAALEP